ncbi:MAG: molybdopterin-dependent oxidoreductase [Lachnospiraceae bacterium]|nr:molybdopterin-dependent oxidoreductase [Lachnospiraceae bacterium]MDD3614691.1 molybdopterin-dependent oxidoreductase [Lachnospiraceae bacterium]
MKQNDITSNYKYVHQPVQKKDAMALVTGQAVYVNDIASKESLIVKVLRSPHAHALIQKIQTESAKKIPGIACVLTYEDVPQKRFTMAGQTYPEPSPYDRLILDSRVRFVGDAVAIVAGSNEKAVDKALAKIKVKYKVLEPLLDFRNAKDHTILVHPEDNWRSLSQVGADNKRNLCASDSDGMGDVDEVLANCKYVVEETYHTLANQQAMMETFRTYTYLDAYGRLNVVSSTQVPFHVRRILANALDISKSKIRVSKPRIGGGFGAKQTVVAEVYPAIVTWITGKPAKMLYSRYESQICSSPRHEMEIKVRVGADEDGVIKGVDMYTLSNTGAFGEHGPTTVGLSGHKAISLYGKLEAYRFDYDVVYTNVMSAGAYRGYGATQGIFALESAVNELADKMHMDPVKLREQNMVREGQIMPSYYGERTNSCALDRCLTRAKEMMNWDEKFPRKKMENGKVRGVGIAMAMQGSGISNVDVGSVTIKLNDEGFYSLSLGAADMGTGCDTILAQIAAEELECPLENIAVKGVDTDVSPYDSGSYASSTTYITGQAVIKACVKLKNQMMEFGADKLGLSVEQVSIDGKCVYNEDNPEEYITISDISYAAECGCNTAMQVTASHSSPVSPPPYMVGMAEVEVDCETGQVELLDYVAVVDCGTTINPNLTRVQTEGGLVQGIGMALYENIQYTEAGQMMNNSFMQYKLPTRQDIGKIRVEFEESYEATGPYGAKSIGEIVINTPSPAIADAVYRATGLRFRELPITAEKIAMGLLEKA